ncbi:Teneurin-2 Ten-2; Tenascin-M2; Ten-m2; Protein Odd Oz/ten-m homolog 2 [Salmonella enterica subsp. arizonae]|uniref:Teneurin-2 Ten-2 Tenascin-M2 Ten-m2 Protein Odd Oz/ten-m homolog 2 n=1 Tax=Salmonella enterica subsp. arizonae TaxID=59203 RepID=A0A379SIJ5_SALER|nr:Teneurin-2 Ten-2; Tenascin-M2; Ten-m2; Protein Odd Oz/ten-m homolog 2 [Salmonella enterica subsp. arizonae]
MSYNDNGWLSAQRVSRDARPLFSTEWHYDLNGNVRQRSDSLAGREFYNHDVMDRLTEHVDVLGRVTNFVYDAAGNRLREETSGSGDEWQCYGRGEEERQVTLEHWYNRNGQLVRRKRRADYLWSQKVVSESLEWDVSGRLKALHSDSGTTQYGYDGLGRRVFKKTTRAGEETASLTWFWWDGDAVAGEVQETTPAEETLTSACDMRRPGSSEAREARLMSLVKVRTVQEYVYYPQSFEPLALIRYGRRWSEKDGFSEPEKRIYFYHNDVNGAPLRLTDETGGVAWSQSAGPWGAWSEQTGSVRNPLRFQGQYFDEESGLHYNRYRYYEPESGRYISADPIGLNGGINLYAYAPNPLTWIDPLGLKCGSIVSYEQARNKALKWLEERGFKAERVNIGKFGSTRGKPVGMTTADGKTGFRIEYDERSGAHINVFSGKDKGEHFLFDASESVVTKLQKLFDLPSKPQRPIS